MRSRKSGKHRSSRQEDSGPDPASAKTVSGVKTGSVYSNLMETNDRDATLIHDEGKC